MLEGDQTRTSQLTVGPVHMHVGQSHRVGDVVLREGKPVAVVPYEAHRLLQAHQQLAQKMGDRSSSCRLPRLTSHSRSTASSTRLHHHNARL